MYGPTDQDVRTFLRILVVCLLLFGAVCFTIGRCSAKYDVKIQAKEHNP